MREGGGDGSLGGERPPGNRRFVVLAGFDARIGAEGFVAFAFSLGHRFSNGGPVWGEGSIAETSHRSERWSRGSWAGCSREAGEVERLAFAGRQRWVIAEDGLRVHTGQAKLVGASDEAQR